MDLFKPNRAGRTSHSRRSRRTWNFQPTLERLDQRLALTTLTSGLVNPSVLATDLPLRVQSVIRLENPYANTPLVLDPVNSPAFAIYFNHSVDSSELSAGDFQLDRIEADGSWTRLVEPGLKTLEDGNNSDASSTSLILSIISPLDPGRYRLFLSATNTIQSQPDQGATPENVLIEEFAMGAQAATAMPVHSLGKITQNVTTVNLPVFNNDIQAPLNELDLPAGTNWTIAPSLGVADPGQFRFVLFDSQMRLILSTTGTNLLGLNQGLESGRYYFQAYQTTSIADGSNPTIPLVITGTMTHREIEPVHQVTPINLNDSDPNADTLLIDLTGIELNSDFFDSSQSAFTLAGENGQSWAVKPYAYDPTTGQMTVSLAGYLPTGHYTLTAVTTSEAGSAASIQFLGSFDIVLHELPVDNLGTIFPDGKEMSGQHPTTVSPGQSVIKQFSVLDTQRYQVGLSNPNLSGEFIQVTKDATGQYSSLVLGNDLAKSFSLAPGIYRIVVTNNTPINQMVSFAVTINKGLPASLSSGGVGQLPASLSQSGLVATSPSPKVSQNFAGPNLEVNPGVEFVSVPTPDNGPDLGVSRNSGDLADSSASLNSAVPLQTSLGPISNSTRFTNTMIPPTHWSAISDSLAGAVHSSVFLNTIEPNMIAEPFLKRQSFPTHSDHQTSPHQGPVSHRSPSDRRGESGFLVADDSFLLSQTEVNDLESSELDVVGMLDVDQRHPTEMLAKNLPGNQRTFFSSPEAETADSPKEQANLTSPIGIIVATCVVLHHIKSTPIRVSPPGRHLFARIWVSATNWLSRHHSPLGRSGKTRSRKRVNFGLGFE